MGYLPDTIDFRTEKMNESVKEYMEVYNAVS